MMIKIMVEKLRINNLEFAPASYLLPKEDYPEKFSWHINYYYPNSYFGREKEFKKEGDWYLNPIIPHFRIHKDCFKHPQTCMAIASFNYNQHEGCYELEFIGDRPLSLSKEEREQFWELLEYGFKQLNGYE